MSDRLARVFDAARDESGLSMKALTVMSDQSDPYRMDTPAHHRDAEWLANVMQTQGLTRQIHNRGLHYAILGQTMPDGRQYVSDGLSVDIPSAADIEPYVGAYYVDADGQTHGGFGMAQPYKLVFVGEKSSLDDVLGPIANRYKADIYLPTGDISNTHIYSIAKTGAEDGRPMVVLYFADADPSGWNMGIAIGRKLQAFRDLHFPELDFQVHRAALTIDQVREFDLPSTPLKESERRADKWRQAFGVEQTEIDALATLRPEMLHQVARDAVAPFYDFDLESRVAEAYQEWRDAAQSVLDAEIDADYLAEIQEQAEQRLSELREQIDAINDSLRIDPGDVVLPRIEVPEAELTQGLAPPPLIDSRWSWLDQTKALIESKNYRQIGGGTDG